MRITDTHPCKMPLFCLFHHCPLVLLVFPNPIPGKRDNVAAKIENTADKIENAYNRMQQSLAARLLDIFKECLNLIVLSP